MQASRATIPVTGRWLCLLLLLPAWLSGSLLFAQQPERPAEVAPTTFPGSALLNHQPPFLAGVAVDHADGVYQAGEKLRVQFQAEKEAHLYLIYHQADGTSRLIFPNEAQPDNRTPARQPTVIPGVDAKFRIRIAPPLGQEVLQVLATSMPVEQLDRLVQKSGKFPLVPPELLEQLRTGPLSDLTVWTEHRVPIRTVAAAELAPPRKAARVGLFIGIGKYLHPEFAATHEELSQSAVTMHDLLLKEGDLDPERTKLVLDEQATKANLQELITRWLPAVSQRGDTVFIYFSGHAGQVRNLDGTEDDGLDELIGPYDFEGGRAGETRAQIEARFRQTNIVDDTLARWLEELQGRQVVLILDTCHSGGVAEGKSLAKGLLADEATRIKDIAQLNSLILTSCAADEQSLFEGTRNKTMWFTYCLTEAIERADRGEPLMVQEAYKYSRKRMRELLKEGNAAREQEPQMIDNILLPIPLLP